MGAFKPSGAFPYSTGDCQPSVPLTGGSRFRTNFRGGARQVHDTYFGESITVTLKDGSDVSGCLAVIGEATTEPREIGGKTQYVTTRSMRLIQPATLSHMAVVTYEGVDYHIEATREIVADQFCRLTSTSTHEISRPGYRK